MIDSVNLSNTATTQPFIQKFKYSSQETTVKV